MKSKIWPTPSWSLITNGSLVFAAGTLFELSTPCGRGPVPTHSDLPSSAGGRGGHLAVSSVRPPPSRFQPPSVGKPAADVFDQTIRQG
jgi:hypothetical protein